MHVKKLKAAGVPTSKAVDFVGEVGTLFYDHETGILRISDGHTPGGHLVYQDLTSEIGDIIPSLDLTYNLGSLTHQWRSLYVGTSTIYIGGIPLTINTATNSLTVNGIPVSGSGGGGGNGWQLTSSTAVVSLNADGILSIPSRIVPIGTYGISISPTNSSNSNLDWNFNANGKVSVLTAPYSASPAQSLIQFLGGGGGGQLGWDGGAGLTGLPYADSLFVASSGNLNVVGTNVHIRGGRTGVFDLGNQYLLGSGGFSLGELSGFTFIGAQFTSYYFVQSTATDYFTTLFTNNTVIDAGSYQGSLAITPVTRTSFGMTTNNKYVFQIKVYRLSAIGNTIGVITNSGDFTQGLGAANFDYSVGFESYGAYNGPEYPGAPKFGVDDWAIVAVDRVNHKIWIKVLYNDGNDGESAWNSDPTADPTTNTGGFDLPTFGGAVIYPAVTSVNGNNYADLGWTFDKSGTINTPLSFPKTFTALLLPVYGGAPNIGPYGGNAWEIGVTFSADADGIVTTSVDNIFPITNNPGYKNGDSWTFHEADHGIPGYTFTLTLGNVVYPGGAGWTANVSTSEPPEYTPTVKSLGAIKLTSNGHSIVLGTDGYLTTESIHVQGSLKGVDGSTGSTGQVLTRQSNGGVAWADSTGGGGAPDGGLADNTAGLTITTSTLATDLNNYDNSGSVTFNIRDAGATTAGIIIKGLTVNHTQTITSDTYAQGDNTVTWSYLDYPLWEQIVSITAYATDSRGYTFYAVANDAWDVPHGPCLVEGTQVTMADGTHKAIEDIQHGELVRVWNFDLGEFSEAQPLWVKAAEETTGYDVYTFSDGTELRTVGHHVFNKEAGAFTKLKYDETPIGTTTFNEHGEEVTLLSKERVDKTTRYYNVWTQYHLNLFADGILTSNRFNNIYPIVDMKFVKDNRVLRDLEEFTGIDEKYITGLRLQEQSQEYTAEYISNYVHNRLERLDIANTAEQGI